MPKRAAYLTIDDGPSERFTELVDFLDNRNLPALFFNRGDAMEARPEAVIYAIQKGFVIGNHGYAHMRTLKMELSEICADIARCDEIIDDLYARANIKRAGKYFRFPYMDRGMGACLVEPDTLSEDHKSAHDDLLITGLGHTPAIPGLCHIDKKRKLQIFLQEQGYDPVPFIGVSIPWYANSEMASAIDALCTYSTSDWAISKRHAGKHGFQTVEDLKLKIDNDPWLEDESSSHIVLAHDQAELFEETTDLIDHFCKIGFEFLDFSPKTI